MNGIIKGAIGLGLGLFFIIILSFMCLEKINQGFIGVVYSANGGVEDKTLNQGVKFIPPWKKVTEYPISLETVEVESLPLATKDGKPLSMDFNYNYANDPAKVIDIFNKFKGAKPEAIEGSFLKSRLRDSALSVTSKYTILEIFQNREVIQTEVEQKFIEDVKQYGFIVSDFVIGTPVPDENTQKAIQRVVDAQQELEALKIEKDKAQEQADRLKIEAQGKAEALLIKSKAEADANRLINASITEKILELERIKKWDGDKNVTTKVVGGNSSVLIGGVK